MNNLSIGLLLTLFIYALLLGPAESVRPIRNKETNKLSAEFAKKAQIKASNKIFKFCEKKDGSIIQNFFD